MSADGQGPSLAGERGDALVDARGLACPLPLVKARQALMLLEAGARLWVLATDPRTPADFEAFCEAAGHELLAVDSIAGVFRLQLVKRA